MKPALVSLDIYGLAVGLHDDDFNLAQLGPVTIEQVSTVDFNPDSQRWEVTWARGELKGLKLTSDMQHVARGEKMMPMEDAALGGRVVDFPSYREAVDAEIMTIEGLRLKGLQWV